MRLLLAHRDRQAKLRADAVEWHDLDLVLCTSTGRPIRQRNTHRSWTRILKQAGVGIAACTTCGTRS